MRELACILFVCVCVHNHCTHTVHTRCLLDAMLGDPPHWPAGGRGASSRSGLAPASTSTDVIMLIPGSAWPACDFSNEFSAFVSRQR